MTDFLGKELKIGDKVVFMQHGRTSSTLYRAVITGFTPLKIKMACCHEDGRVMWSDTKYPRHVIKVNWGEGSL